MRQNLRTIGQGGSAAEGMDVAGLVHELRQTVRGEVRFDDGTRGLYSTDASNYRQVPIGVVVPKDADDVVATVRACRSSGVPVLSRGGGTSLAGQCCNAAPVSVGWRDRDVLESLDLCLSCKGCKGECPVQVDMATYKAEFYAHHYKGRIRPSRPTRSVSSTGGRAWPPMRRTLPTR